MKHILSLKNILSLLLAAVLVSGMVIGCVVLPREEEDPSDQPETEESGTTEEQESQTDAPGVEDDWSDIPFYRGVVSVIPSDCMRGFEMNETISAALREVLNGGKWKDGVVDHHPYYHLEVRDNTIAYDSRRGIFCDLTMERTLTLSDDDRIKLNRFYNDSVEPVLRKLKEARFLEDAQRLLDRKMSNNNGIVVTSGLDLVHAEDLFVCEIQMDANGVPTNYISGVSAIDLIEDEEEWPIPAIVIREDIDIQAGKLYPMESLRVYKKGNPSMVAKKMDSPAQLAELSKGIYYVVFGQWSRHNNTEKSYLVYTEHIFIGIVGYEPEKVDRYAGDVLLNCPYQGSSWEMNSADSRLLLNQLNSDGWSREKVSYKSNYGFHVGDDYFVYSPDAGMFYDFDRQIYLTVEGEKKAFFNEFFASRFVEGLEDLGYSGWEAKNQLLLKLTPGYPEGDVKVYSSGGGGAISPKEYFCGYAEFDENGKQILCIEGGSGYEAVMEQTEEEIPALVVKRELKIQKPGTVSYGNYTVYPCGSQSGRKLSSLDDVKNLSPGRYYVIFGRTVERYNEEKKVTERTYQEYVFFAILEEE